MKRTQIIATIKKVRFVSMFKSRTGDEYHEIHYTVEGSDKTYKHHFYHTGSMNDKLFWRRDELAHLLSDISGWLKPVGDGTRCRTLYDRQNDDGELKVVIDYYRNGKIWLSVQK